MAPLFYRDSDGAVLVFDLTNRDSFKLVEKWIEELRVTCDNINMILCGNKCDMANPSIEFQEAEEYIK